jgi:hypothetical protein
MKTLEILLKIDFLRSTCFILWFLKNILTYFFVKTIENKPKKIRLKLKKYDIMKKSILMLDKSIIILL